MGINHFSEEQVKELQCHPYVDNASVKAITYSEAFKAHFLAEYGRGKMPTQIFKEAGFDPKILGKMRIDNFTRRVKKMNDRPEGLTDLRGQRSGRPREKNRTPEEELTYLRHQVALQKQQIEALKKTNSINRKAAQASHKKNSN